MWHLRWNTLRKLLNEIASDFLRAGRTEWKCDMVLAGQASRISAYAQHRALVNGASSNQNSTLTKPFLTICSSATHYVRTLQGSTSFTSLNGGYFRFWVSSFLRSYCTLVTKILKEKKRAYGLEQLPLTTVWDKLMLTCAQDKPMLTHHALNWNWACSEVTYIDIVRKN
jgi:hypothetical protein